VGAEGLEPTNLTERGSSLIIPLFVALILRLVYDICTGEAATKPEICRGKGQDRGYDNATVVTGKGD
jgi:hypothetical protein